MANTVSNVVAGKPKVTGGIYRGPLGTPIPVGTTATLDSDLESAGYVGDAGLTETVDATTNKIKAWGGDIVKVLQSEHSVSYAWTFIEALNPVVLAAVHGADNVAVTAATVSAGTKVATKITSEETPHEVYVFEMKDGDAVVRICVPDGKLQRNGDTTYVDDNVIGYPVTLEAFPDEDGVKAYKYSDDGVFAAA